MKTINLKVNLRGKTKDRSYKLIIGNNILGKLGDRVKALNIGKSIFILTDSNVGKLYSKQIIKSFKDAGFNDIEKYEMKAGERSKTFEKAMLVLTKLHEFDKYQQKKIIIVNLGGGVVSDLGGFVAGIYKRGRSVDYIQIPTTLLSQVDSGVGGKVGVNFKGKNLVGLFLQPRLVYIDLKVLQTLPLRELRSGLSEIVKYSVIVDSNLFDYLEKHYNRVFQYDYNIIKHIVATCVKIKIGIVEKDERDTKNIRIKLNFGHTIGHAIESSTNYSRYTHGEAISAGMVCAGEIANQLGMFNGNNLSRLENLLKEIGLPVKIKEGNVRKIINSMKHDKKFINGRNCFVLPEKIGKVVVKEGISETLIKKTVSKRIC